MEKILESYNDFRFVHGALPFSDYTTLGVSVVSYLAVVGLLSQIMKNQKRMDLKWVVVLHNAFLCFISFAMLVGVLYELAKKAATIPNDELVETFFCDGKKRLVSGGQVFWFYLFYLSKFYEFLDTVIICLKKRPLIFLHVYHHFITAILMYVMLDNAVAVQWIAVVANVSVHIPMYYYYAVSSLGINVWWKKYITRFQIIQFVTDISANTIGFYFHYVTNQSCSGSLQSWIFGQLVLVSFLDILEHGSHDRCFIYFLMNSQVKIT